MTGKRTSQEDFKLQKVLIGKKEGGEVYKKQKIHLPIKSHKKVLT